MRGQSNFCLLVGVILMYTCLTEPLLWKENLSNMMNIYMGCCKFDLSCERSETHYGYNVEVSSPYLFLFPKLCIGSGLSLLSVVFWKQENYGLVQTK